EHFHEPSDLLRLEWMADIAVARSPRIHDQVAFGIEEGKEGKALTLAAQFAEHGSSAGVLERLVLFIFVDHELRDHEVGLEDRLDFRGLDKLIESAAPPSPGRVEEEEDVFMSGGCVGSGLGEDGVRGRNCRIAGG